MVGLDRRLLPLERTFRVAVISGAFVRLVPFLGGRDGIKSSRLGPFTLALFLALETIPFPLLPVKDTFFVVVVQEALP